MEVLISLEHSRLVSPSKHAISIDKIKSKKLFCKLSNSLKQIFIISQNIFKLVKNTTISGIPKTK
jgi:hypothetical protein